MTLSTGETPDFPENWGFPTNPYNYCTGEYTSCGMIWYGKERATLNDVLAVLDDPRTDSRKIDRLTLCGTSDPAWTTEAEVLLTTNPGGCYKQHYSPG